MFYFKKKFKLKLNLYNWFLNYDFCVIGEIYFNILFLEWGFWKFFIDNLKLDLN